MSDVDAVRALMEADRWIDRVTGQREHLPELAELATVESELRGLLGALTEAQAALAPVRTAYEDASAEVERMRRRAADLERTLGASTANPRELTALQGELTHVRELLGAAEEREIELLIEVEPLEEVVRAIRERAQPAVARRADLQAAVAELRATLDDELAALRERRHELAAAVSPETLALYDRALARTGGSGAAQVDGGRCDGCRIALSPLDVDRWKSWPAGTFMNCPECQRLLLP